VPRRRALQFCGDGTSLDLVTGSSVQADPLANVRRAISQLDSAIFTEPQEAYGGLIDELDFAQVYHQHSRLVCDSSFEVVQVLRLDTADEPQYDFFVVELLDDSQNHFSRVVQQKCRALGASSAELFSGVSLATSQQLSNSRQVCDGRRGTLVATLSRAIFRTEVED
jgi:hypothetical protein